VPDSEYSGFGLMPNPGVYSRYLCGLELAELGTHEYEYMKNTKPFSRKTMLIELPFPTLFVLIATKSC
jgi:hypothetical protein